MEKLFHYESVTIRSVLTDQRDEKVDDSQNTIAIENDITINKNLTQQNHSAIEVMMQINKSIKKDRKK